MSREESLQALEQQIEETVEGESLPEEGQKQVVKEGVQPPEESTTPESEVSPKPDELDIREPISVSDEDIEKVYQSNVQKRINKLVAQKSHALDENRELKAKLSELEKKIQDMQKPKEREYSMSELQRALIQARESGDVGLEFEIQENIAKNLQKKREAELEKTELEKRSFQDQEEKVWGHYIANFPISDDQDLDVNNRGSALFVWTRKLYEKNREHYDAFGVYRLVQACNDARALILKSKSDKVNNDKTRTLEKKLGRERMKSELGAGVSAAGDESTGAVTRDELLDGLNERMSQFNRARAVLK